MTREPMRAEGVSFAVPSRLMADFLPLAADLQTRPLVGLMPEAPTGLGLFALLGSPLSSRPRNTSKFELTAL